MNFVNCLKLCRDFFAAHHFVRYIKDYDKYFWNQVKERWTKRQNLWKKTFLKQFNKRMDKNWWGRLDWWVDGRVWVSLRIQLCLYQWVERTLRRRSLGTLNSPRKSALLMWFKVICKKRNITASISIIIFFSAYFLIWEINVRIIPECPCYVIKRCLLA